jgi:hypothetical protein
VRGAAQRGVIKLHATTVLQLAARINGKECRATREVHIVSTQFASILASATSALAAGGIAYYLSKDEPESSGVPIFVLAFLGGMIAGAAIAMPLTESESAATQTYGLVFLLALIGAISGVLAGKHNAAKVLRPPSPNPQPPLDPAASSHGTAKGTHTKIAHLEVNLGRQDPELLRQARERSIDDNPTRINEKYIELRIDQLKEQQSAQHIDGSRNTRIPTRNRVGSTPVRIDATSRSKDANPVHTDKAEQPSRTRNYVARHWRGELPLVISYWVNVVLLGAVFAGMVAVVSSPTLAQHVSLNAIRLSFAFVVLSVPLYIWQLVGCWRSGSRHKSIGKSPSWGTVAQFMLVLSLLSVVAQWYQHAPTFYEMAKISFEVDTLSEYRITLIDDEELKVEGYITFGIRNEIDNIMDENKNIWLIHLQSPGGRIGPARNLRDFIEDSRLTTYAATECSSACTIAFMGGDQRVVHQDARLGFHASSLPGQTPADIRNANAIDKTYFAQKGAHRQFVERAFNTPNSTIWYPDLKTLINSGVITHVFDGQDIIPTEEISR